MSKKFKLKNEKLWEIIKEQSGLKRKKKALQYECSHKDRKGAVSVKYMHDPDNKFLFRCKQCRKKIDLGILDEDKKGALDTQLKNARKTIISFVDLVKLQSGPKDKKVLEVLANGLKALDVNYHLLKKLIKPNKAKKKLGRHKLNVMYGGKSVLD